MIGRESSRVVKERTVVHRAVTSASRALLVLMLHVSAAGFARAKPLFVASADGSSANDADELHPAAAGDGPQPGPAEVSQVIRREAEPLTAVGAVGLMVIIGIMRGFTMWALRLSSPRPAEEGADGYDDACQA